MPKSTAPQKTAKPYPLFPPFPEVRRMDEQEDGRRVRPTYDEAFKREAVRLVVDEGDTFKAPTKSRLN